MKLTKKELIEVAETLHQFDWLTECTVLIPVYQELCKKHPYVTKQSKDWQKIVLVQYHYRKKTMPTPQEQFLAKMRLRLLSIGAVQDAQEQDCFNLDTKAGMLTLRLTPHGTDELGTVFGRFDDPSVAKQFTSCNPHSGKWNHHYFQSEKTTLDMALADLEKDLREIL